MKKWIALFATITLTLGIAISVQKTRAHTATATVAAGKPDLIVGNGGEKVVIELKAVESVGHKERTQIENYLRVLDIPFGLLINFPQPTKSKAARDGVEFIEVLKEE